MAVKPLDTVYKNINNRVIVKLKGNREYRGTLDGFDPHMNLVLKNCDEVHEDKVVNKFELAIIRGDNVIYLSP
jgi:small nuclear ribonucleoprotein